MHESMLGKMHFKHPSIFLLRYLMYTDKQFKHFRRTCSFAAIDERRHPNACPSLGEYLDQHVCYSKQNELKIERKNQTFTASTLRQILLQLNYITFKNLIHLKWLWLSKSFSGHSHGQTLYHLLVILVLQCCCHLFCSY